MKTVLLHAIRLYQRHLSPRKGYACACRVHTGRASCSALGYRAIRRHGAWRGLLILRLRLQRCAQAQRELASAHRAPTVARPRLHSQAGYCDAPGILGEAVHGLTSGLRSAACLLSLRSPLAWIWPSRAGDAYDASEEGYSWLVQILRGVKTLYGALVLLMLFAIWTGNANFGVVAGHGGLLFLGMPWSVFFESLPGHLGLKHEHDAVFLEAFGVLFNFTLLSALVSLAKRAEEED